MKKYFILLIVIVLTGCSKKNNPLTEVNNFGDFVVSDDMIQLKTNDWGESSKNIIQNFVDQKDYRTLYYHTTTEFYPNQTVTFSDFNLKTSSLTFISTEEKGFIEANFHFKFDQQEDAENKRKEIIEYCEKYLPNTLQYSFSDQSGALVDSVTLEIYKQPMSIWQDANFGQLIVEIRYIEKQYILLITVHNYSS